MVDSTLPVNTTARLGKLRALFSDPEYKIDAYVIPSEDAHQSEYVADCDKRRQFISGFSGSAGAAVVTLNSANLFTDGRYFLQAAKEMDSNWTLMKVGVPGVPTISRFLSELPQNSRVGIDPSLISSNEAERYMGEFKKNGISLVPIMKNLIDSIWENKPPVPTNSVFHLDLRYSGKDWSSKISEIRNDVKSLGGVGLLVGALDQIAWLFNLRGSDIMYNPLFFSYAYVGMDNIFLFMDKSKLTQEALKSLEGVDILPYDAVFDKMRELIPSLEQEKSKVVVDSSVNWALVQTLGNGNIIQKMSPITVHKSIKNDVELEGMRQSHIRDGVAMVNWYTWLERELAYNGGNLNLSECDVADKLELFRREQKDCVGLSFDTISSVGPNAAVIHYSPTRGSDSKLDISQIYLVDSGGQYYDGTTDVTRTWHFGTPTEFERECFTRVLKGHIALDSIVFPEGTSGYVLDPLARSSLWQAGLDYRHGTGHGVGSFLNVHEGPHGIAVRPGYLDTGLRRGMIVTNEPGYYEDGKFGIRIENTCEIISVDTPNHFGGTKFLKLHSLTLCPIQRKLITSSLMSPEDTEWINLYHKRVWDTLSPFFSIGSPEYTYGKKAKSRILKSNSKVNEEYNSGAATENSIEESDLSNKKKTIPKPLDQTKKKNRYANRSKKSDTIPIDELKESEIDSQVNKSSFETNDIDNSLSPRPNTKSIKKTKNRTRPISKKRSAKIDISLTPKKRKKNLESISDFSKTPEALSRNLVEMEIKSIKKSEGPGPQKDGKIPKRSSRLLNKNPLPLDLDCTSPNPEIRPISETISYSSSKTQIKKIILYTTPSKTKLDSDVFNNSEKKIEIKDYYEKDKNHNIHHFEASLPNSMDESLELIQSSEISTNSADLYSDINNGVIITNPQIDTVNEEIILSLPEPSPEKSPIVSISFPNPSIFTTRMPSRRLKSNSSLASKQKYFECGNTIEPSKVMDVSNFEPDIAIQPKVVDMNVDLDAKTSINNLPISVSTSPPFASVQSYKNIDPFSKNLEASDGVTNKLSIGGLVANISDLVTQTLNSSSISQIKNSDFTSPLIASQIDSPTLKKPLIPIHTVRRSRRALFESQKTRGDYLELIKLQKSLSKQSADRLFTPIIDEKNLDIKSSSPAFLGIDIHNGSLPEKESTLHNHSVSPAIDGSDRLVSPSNNPVSEHLISNSEISIEDPESSKQEHHEKSIPEMPTNKPEKKSTLFSVLKARKKVFLRHLLEVCDQEKPIDFQKDGLFSFGLIDPSKFNDSSSSSSSNNPRQNLSDNQNLISNEYTNDTQSLDYLEKNIENSEKSEHDSSLNKIGEASYSEVFMSLFDVSNSNSISIDASTNMMATTSKFFKKDTSLAQREATNAYPTKGLVQVAFKVIPFGSKSSSSPSGDKQPSFLDLYMEIASSYGLSWVADNERVCICQGKFPQILVDSWDRWKNDHPNICYNLRPDFYSKSQLYAVLVLEYGGETLETAQLSNWKQAQSIMRQLTLSLALAEHLHRDLHWGNIMVKKCDPKISFLYRKVSNKDNINSDSSESKPSFTVVRIPSYGVRCTIIDYTLSRLDLSILKEIDVSRDIRSDKNLDFFNTNNTSQNIEPKGDDIFYVNMTDPHLYNGVGDIQYDVYRDILQQTGGNWHDFYPKTNVLWLMYVLEKLLYCKQKSTNKKKSQGLKQMDLLLIDFLKFVRLNLSDASCNHSRKSVQKNGDKNSMESNQFFMRAIEKSLLSHGVDTKEDGVYAYTTISALNCGTYNDVSQLSMQWIMELRNCGSSIDLLDVSILKLPK
ncbi:putative Xaa-Pro aminopeptidase P [Smittium mucronatum]|uniref:Putative Xaa-Pro aminopeptidase P n=1 Tax=Smittium mucronatum TaxID=133383 RepID=A0A1R0H6J7_9FUNG|nr:putative Xaa-Pro aminopeptidase P [Smittium mucronatum]